MRDPIQDTCDMCLRDEKVRHVNLYTKGSEGTLLCHHCEMRLVDLIRSERSEAGRLRFEVYKAAKRVSQEIEKKLDSDKEVER